VPSAKSPSAKPAEAIVSATAKTRSVIEDLKARLTAEARDPAPPSEPEAEPESIEDLERELEVYFERTASRYGAAPSRSQLLIELRSHVIDRVVDRILAEWSSLKPGGSPFGREVMDRLIERVLLEFRRTASSEDSKT
jgi:hypothetical protein